MKGYQHEACRISGWVAAGQRATPLTFSGSVPASDAACARLSGLQVRQSRFPIWHQLFPNVERSATVAGRSSFSPQRVNS